MTTPLRLHYAPDNATDEGDPIPYPFKSAVEMLEMAKTSRLTIAQMKRANEVSRQPPCLGRLLYEMF